MSIEVLIFLALASGFAGFVDAMAGGGGLIQLPALLIGLPNKELPLILGTNKVPSIFGTAAAARNYFKNIKPRERVVVKDDDLGSMYLEDTEVLTKDGFKKMLDSDKEIFRIIVKPD